MKSGIFNNLKSKLIFGKYSIKYLISKGTFGEVYCGTNIINGKNCAMKIEELNKNNSSLKDECYILLNLKGPGIPSVISYGVFGKYNILVENLLGKSFKDIWLENNKKLNLKDTCIFAIQAISRLEYVHSKNYLHRDIKPANFLVGNPDNSQIYLIDFGNARKFISSRTGKHIKYKKTKEVFGALIFLSKNVLNAIEQTRKDELESLGLVIIYLFIGSLPWSEFKFKSIYEGIIKINSIRKKISIDNLCQGMPKEMKIYMNYVNNLKYDECPNYEYLRQLFLNILNKIDEINDQHFSWVDKNKITSSKQALSKNKNRSIKSLFNNLLKKNSNPNVILCQNPNRELNNNEEMRKTYEYSDIDNLHIKKNISLTENSSINNNLINSLNNNKLRKANINNIDNKMNNIIAIKENMNKIPYPNKKELKMKDKLVFIPKKINQEKIIKTTSNNKKNIRKFRNDKISINNYEESYNKDKTNSKYLNSINYAKTEENEYDNNKKRNYINIMNFNINNNSNFYTYETNIKNNQSKKLDKNQKNNFNKIKIFSYKSRFNSSNRTSKINFKFEPKIYKSIFNKESPYHINLTEYELDLNKFKHPQSKNNSINSFLSTKNFPSKKNLRPLSIQDNYIRNTNNFQNSNFLSKYRFTKINTSNNII